MDGHVTPKRVDRHNHPPMDSQVVGSRKVLEQFQTAYTERIEFGGRIEPNLHEDRDDLLSVSSERVTTDRHFVFQKALQGIVDGGLLISSQNQVGDLLKPLQPHPLAESNLIAPTVHVLFLSI